MRRVAHVLIGISAVLLVAVVVLVSSQSSHPQRALRVLSARTSDETTLLDLSVASCRGRLFGSIEDGPDAVRITVTSSEVDEHKGCTSRMVLPLGAPLLSRSLIDTATGATIPVEKVATSELVPPGILRRAPAPR